MLYNDDNAESDGELKINSNYAKIYDNWRQKEELHKLKIKYGESESTNSSSSEDDDEDKNIEDPQFNKEFYKILAYLKTKDTRLYDKEVKFFDNIDKPKMMENTEKKLNKNSKKKESLFLRDYERKILMERDGRFSSSEDEDDVKRKTEIGMPTYVEEQQKLKDSFKHALKNEENEDTDFLKIKEKTEDEKQKEEESYKEWLKGQKSEIDPQEQKEFKSLRDYWTDPNLDVNEKFLRDYILDNKYRNKESCDADLDHDQIAHDSDENLSEDEKTICKQEEFEHKYNFRFEEPDQEFIKRYPRTIENSLRKKDTRRAEKRVTIRERKKEEKQRKTEELKQMKALKRKEIEEKIEQLKEITGNTNLCFDNVDFDADFDPNEHDRKMEELFNEEYYACVESDMKPKCPEIDEELGIESTWDDYDPITDKIDTEDTRDEPHCEDSDFNMDADYDKSHCLESELVESMKKRKRKRRSKAFATLIAKEKPKFDPKQFPSYEEYFNQYYSLDYEDMIEDLPCRFKYRKVIPNDYGLSVEEILTADDRELNVWCSLNKALQYKSEQVEMKEVQSYKQKAANEALKRKILKSLYIEPEAKQEDTSKSIEYSEQIDTSKKKHRRRKKAKLNSGMDSTNTDIASNEKTANMEGSNTQNNAHDSCNDKKQEETARKKEQDKVNKSKKQKRKAVLIADEDASSAKIIKTQDIQKKNFQIKIHNDKEEKSSEKTVENNRFATEERSKNKQLLSKKLSKQMKTKKHNPNKDKANEMMSLNAERLKMYGINARKFKNKLKYGKKKF